VVNTNALADRTSFTQTPSPTDYDGETTEQRLARRAVRWMPAQLRVWLVLRLARRLVRQTYGGTRATIRDVRRERGELDLRGSVFCQVRTPVDSPLCQFYAAAVNVLCRRFDLSMTAEAVECRAIGAPRCLIVCAVHDGTDA